MKKYYLHVTTFKGSCPGAIHFYGHIQSGDLKDEFYVENKGKDMEGCKQRFLDKKSVILSALRMFKEKKLKGVLYFGSLAIAQPQQMLIGPKKLKDSENELWRKIEKFYEKGGWEKHPKQMEKICQQWMKLWEGYGGWSS